MTQSKSRLGFSGTWSMAVGGMIGGGIFSTLGVVIGIAGLRGNERSAHVESATGWTLDCDCSSRVFSATSSKCLFAVMA